MQPPPAFSHQHRLPRDRHGFALLITITLLAFLVLLLVSLASLTRVETQVAGNNQQLSQARQNALMALNLALGEVQRATGPDRRITAPANLTSATAASPRWVGVYGNTAAADYTQTPSAITPSSSRLVQWLVSGNEGLTITADATGTLTSATPSFAAAPGDAITVSGGSLSSATATSDITLGSGNIPARLLVGPGSVDATNAAADYVVAPLKEIRAAAGSVPGLAASATPVIGAYAWWAGDESTKAKINLRNSYLSQSTSADQTAFQRYGFMTAQRSAVELMNYDSTNALTGLYSETDPSIPNLLAVNQLPFVASAAADQAKLTSASKFRFHDLTARGYGVLADAYAGGLKKDLSADVANLTTTASGNRPADDTPIFPRQASADRVPTWGLLRAFPRTNPSSGSLAPLTPVINASGDYTSPAIAPVINFGSLGMDFFIDGSNNLRVALFPVVVIWNPYATTIRKTNYDLGFHVTTRNVASVYYLETRPTASGGWTIRATLNLSNGTFLAGSEAATTPGGFVRFTLAGEDLQPGEAQVYMLGSTEVDYDTAGGTRLVRCATGVTNKTNYVTWPSPAGMTITAAEKTNGQLRIRSTNPNANNNNLAMDIVLAKTGTLGSVLPTNAGLISGNCYQTVLDAKLGVRSFTAGNDAYPGYGRNTGYALSSYEVAGPTSIGATTSLVVSEVMEGKGGYNSQPQFVGAMGTANGQGGRFRWLITGNPRAPIVQNTYAENNNVFTRGNLLFGSNMLSLSQGNTGFDLVYPYAISGQYNSAIGGSQHPSDGVLRAPLFDILNSKDLFLSLGQLQHASLGLYGFYSSYPFGNAWADVRVPRESQYYSGSLYVRPGYDSAYTENLYDLSWHLNRAIWDRYFVSGVPSSWTSSDVTAVRTLPDARMSYYRRSGALPAIDDIRYTGASSTAYDKASANLVVDGAFNVNSTSEQAWRALLGSTLGIPANTDYADSGDSVATIAPVPRFSGNQSQTGFTNTMNLAAGNYLGNRGLQLSSSNVSYTPAALKDLVNELARTLVAEVKTRGPFLSVGDFVNRRLVTAASANSATGIRGTLQAAIDSMGATAATTAAVNTKTWTNTGAALGSGDKPVTTWDTDHFLGAPSASSTSQNATRFAASPKFLTQADLLSLLGPALTVRGDTFVIRTYGETRNAVTGNVEGRAWCEAVVQRQPDYINASADAAETSPASLTNAENRTFGRRYKIVSLRWLSPSDI
jgi:hypothetical protein